MKGYAIVRVEDTGKNQLQIAITADECYSVIRDVVEWQANRQAVTMKSQCAALCRDQTIIQIIPMAQANPITYIGKNGQQYVVVDAADMVVAFALP